MASLLPLPDDPRFPALIAAWPERQDGRLWYNRAEWLGNFEAQLRIFYPASSSRDRKLTARHYAPFPLAAGPNVP